MILYIYISEVDPHLAQEQEQAKLTPKGNYYSSMASKPINIRWIRVGSLPCEKNVYSIVLKTIFHEYF